MKFHVMLLASLMMPIGAFAAEAADTQLFPFKLGTDQFDPEVTQWRAGIMSNLGIVAQKYNSEWAKWTLARTEVSLADACADETVMALAKDRYAQLQKDPLVQLTFKAMVNAAQLSKHVQANMDAPAPEIQVPAGTPTLSEILNDLLAQRQLVGQTFRKVAVQQLVTLRKAELPLMQDPTPGSAHALDEFIERNEATPLDENVKKTYAAYDLILYTLRQNHRLVDAETDGANLLLHKNVTEKPKDS